MVSAVFRLIIHFLALVTAFLGGSVDGGVVPGKEAAQINQPILYRTVKEKFLKNVIKLSAGSLGARPKSE